MSLAVKPNTWYDLITCNPLNVLFQEANAGALLKTDNNYVVL